MRQVLPIAILLFLFSSFYSVIAQDKTDTRPNIIFILSDDLSWGDLGCYGQQKIKTPNIDRLAKEGIRFTQAYAGNSVCAPSRSSLMQGLHPGHARVRGNSSSGFRESLQIGDTTIAMLAKQAGYRTGVFGKWGLANHDQPGIPNEMGFDEFFGYLNQRHAHCYYPEFLYHNEERIFYPKNGSHHELRNYSRRSLYDLEGRAMPNGIDDPAQAVYSFDAYCDKSLDFVKSAGQDPFFLYLAYTTPHGPLVVPELGAYHDMEWDIQYKEWAAMVTRMDTEVGKLLSLLKELNIDKNTLIIFASDNGDSSHGYEPRYLEEKAGPTISQFFNLESPTRGRKGDSYDGAFHVPAIAWWPARIAQGKTSDHMWAFWDIMPTIAEIIDVEAPRNIDGISILPTLTGEGRQKQHDFLYWEYQKAQAVRSGQWFAHKESGAEAELYHLEDDPRQANNVRQKHPNVINRLEGYMEESHGPSDVWASPGESQEDFEKRMKESGIGPRPNNIGNF